MSKDIIFLKGDRVIYTGTRYSDSPANPMWGGQHGNIVGTVDQVNVDRRGMIASVGVAWDNGCHNGYEPNNLSLFDAPEGNCQSIWGGGM